MRYRLNWLAWALVALVGTGCGSEGPLGGGEGGDAIGPFPEPGAMGSSGGGAAAVGVAPAEPGTAQSWIERGGFVVHEWGTYTSLQSSVGETMLGMHRVEELLPEFVHTITAEDGPFKGLLTAPEGVTQRLETPVLYFYVAEEMRARVEVAFPEGLVSEFYPNVIELGPQPGPDLRVADGRASWEVTLRPGLVEVPPVPEGDIWAPSRDVPAAASVLAGAEAERFIFYRGLGAFNRPVRVREASLDRLVLANESSEDLGRVFLIRVHEDGAGIEDLGALPAGAVIDAMPSPKERDFDAYLGRAKAMLQEALEDTGLYPDEARAMVETWERSYFLSPGIRVLYIAPESWADELLPIDITPQPDELVRTFVGRIEILTADEEVALAGRLEGVDWEDLDAMEEAWALVDELGRLAEPKLLRVHQLLESAAARQVCEMLIAYARTQP